MKHLWSTRIIGDWNNLARMLEELEYKGWEIFTLMRHDNLTMVVIRRPRAETEK